MHCVSEKIGLTEFEKLKNQSTKIQEKMKEKQQKQQDLQNEIKTIKKHIFEKLKIINRQKLESKELLKIKMKYILTTNDKEEIEPNQGEVAIDDDENREIPQMGPMQTDEIDENEHDEQTENELDENENEEEDIDLASDLETIVGGGYGSDSTQLSAIENAASFGPRLSNRSSSFSQRQRSRMYLLKRHSYTPDPEPNDLHNNNNHYMSDFQL